MEVLTAWIASVANPKVSPTYMLTGVGARDAYTKKRDKGEEEGGIFLVVWWVDKGTLRGSPGPKNQYPEG